MFVANCRRSAVVTVDSVGCIQLTGIKCARSTRPVISYLTSNLKSNTRRVVRV